MENKTTAVRHLKEQNDMQYENLVWSDCKLRDKTGRAAVTGRQRSESAGRFGQVFQKNPKMDFHGTHAIITK